MKNNEKHYSPGSLARIFMVDNFHIIATYEGMHPDIFITKNNLAGFLCLLTGRFEYSKNWGEMLEVLIEGDLIFLRKENLQVL